MWILAVARTLFSDLNNDVVICVGVKNAITSVNTHK